MRDLSISTLFQSRRISLGDTERLVTVLLDVFQEVFRWCYLQ